MGLRPTFTDVTEAYERIKEYIHLTPILTSSALNRLSSQNAGLGDVGIELYFKCENLQKTGAFKARGACNAIIKEKSKHPDGFVGVVTQSSGNHGQAVAWASSKDVANVSSTVVVPKTTSKVKCDAIQGYGSELVLCENSSMRKVVCEQIAAETGKTIIPPFDHVDVIAGQGTIAYEMLEIQGLKDLDAILVPVSGGGMTAGIAIAAKAINPNIKVIAVEAMGKNLGPCLKSGERLWPNPPEFLNTIAEGITSQQCGHLTFPILCDLIEKDVISMTDEEMIQATKIVGERMKLIIEVAAGASSGAAIYRSKEILDKWPSIRKIGVILCGGNIDLDKLPWIV